MIGQDQPYGAMEKGEARSAAFCFQAVLHVIDRRI